jgi:CHAT domain-containing protein
MDQYLPQLLKQGVIEPETQKKLDPYVKQLEPFYLYFKADQLSKAGQTDRAIETYQQALTGLQRPLQLGDLKQYLDAKTSVVFQQIVQDFQIDYHGKTHRALGEIYAKRGQHDQAIAKYQQAIRVLDRKPTTSNTFATKGANEKRATYFLMGQAYAALKQTDRAFQTFQTVLNLQTKDPDIIEQANTYWELASLEQQRGNLDQAQKQIETAIERLESQPPTKTPAKSDAAKAQPVAKSRYKSYLNLVDYLDSKRNYYDFYVGLLMQRHQQDPRVGYDVLAFQAVERSRSRSLRTLRYSDPKVAIAEAEKQALKATLNTSLKNLQLRMPENTMLLSYHLGDQQSYLWQITRNGFQTHSLPPRAQIEKAARQFRDQIQAKNYSATRSLKIAIATPKNEPNPNSAKVNPAASLSEMLLRPIAPSLNNQTIMITADGALQYIPFNALPKPAIGNSATNNVIPLLIEHEVVGLPSAFMLGFNQNKPSIAAKTLAIFADPVYHNLDDRVKTTQPKSPITFYDRLPGTGQEANAITTLIPQDQQWRNYDFDASYRNAINNQLNQYRIIHFATHGQFDSEKPQRSGMVFSSLDATGLPQRGLFSTVVNPFPRKVPALRFVCPLHENLQ